MLTECFLSLALLQSILCCSPMIGGDPGPPTVEENVSFAEFVAVGEVKEIIRPDPEFADIDSAYGAKVGILCGYKGQMTADITVVGAGFIPGLCTAKELEKGKKYILFLEKRGNYYEQRATAMKPEVDWAPLMKVCKLSLTFGSVSNNGCLATTNAQDCTKYDPNALRETTTTERPGSGSPLARVISLTLLFASLLMAAIVM